MSTPSEILVTVSSGQSEGRQLTSTVGPAVPLVWRCRVGDVGTTVRVHADGIAHGGCRALMSESASGPVGWNPKRGPFSDTVLAINFVADAGRLMLESSTSVSEVEDRLHRFLPVVGLDGCALEGTLNSLTLSYWQPGQAMPITTMRNVRVATPRLERLAGADRLLDQVENGTLELDEAVSRLRDLEDAPFPSQRSTRVAILLSVIGWLIFVDGLDLVTVVVALLATILTFPIDALVRRLHFPALGATFLVATVVAAIPNLLAAAGVSLLVGPAVVGALFIHLPGRAFVSSVIDGLANSPLSSISRGIEAVATAGFLALGMLVGNKIGTGLGLSYTPDVTATPIPQSLIGSGLGVLGLAVAWTMPRRQIAPAVAISAMGWLIVALFTAGLASQADWLGYALAAGVVGHGRRCRRLPPALHRQRLHRRRNPAARARLHPVHGHACDRPG